MEFRIKAKERLDALQKKADATISALLGKPLTRSDGSAQLLDEEDAARLRRRAAVCALWCVAGFLLQGASALLGTHPFGIALLSVVGRSGAFFVWAGGVAGALAGSSATGSSAFCAAVILSMVLGARILLSAHVELAHGDAVSEEEESALFGEPLRIRLAVCTMAAFLSGMYTVIVDQFNYQGILALLFGLFAAPISASLFYCGLEQELPISLREVGRIALLYAIVYSLSNHSLFGLSLALIVSTLLTLTSALGGGLVRGTLVGLICGMASGESALLLAVGGLAAGALRMFGAGTAMFCFLAITAGLKIWSVGLWSAIPFTGNLLFGALIFLPLEKSGTLAKLHLFPTSEAPELTEDRLQVQEEKRLRRLAGAFDELSGMMLKLSEQLRSPGAGEVRALCENVFLRHCRRCQQNLLCWQQDYEGTQNALRKLAEAIPLCGLPSRKDLPAYFSNRCKQIDKILADIGKEMTELVEGAVLRDNTELFALDYEAISELLRESAEDDGDHMPDDDLRRLFAEALRQMGIQAIGCGAWGKRQKMLIASGVTLSSISDAGREIRKKLEEKTGLLLTDPEFKFSGESVSMQLCSRQRLKLTAARAGSVKVHEEMSGDMARSFPSEIGYGYSLICDGMGSGRSAAAVAQVSAVFLEKMLSAGNRKSVTLKLLSNFIRGRADECHCTVDLLEVDLYSGSASFVKCGATPSYVLREGNIFKIDVSSMPLGLTREINAEEISMVLRAGDVILQTSDGVAGCLEEALWLPELFASLEGKGVQEIAAAIHSRTLAEKGCSDDITVLVTRIE